MPRLAATITQLPQDPGSAVNVLLREGVILPADGVSYYFTPQQCFMLFLTLQADPANSFRATRMIELVGQLLADATRNEDAAIKRLRKILKRIDPDNLRVKYISDACKPYKRQHKG